MSKNRINQNNTQYYHIQSKNVANSILMNNFRYNQQRILYINRFFNFGILIKILINNKSDMQEERFINPQKPEEQSKNIPELTIKLNQEMKTQQSYAKSQNSYIEKQACVFCQNQIVNENDGLRFACLHNFHEICFKLIAPDSSFCPYCPNNLFGTFFQPQPIKIEEKEQQSILKNRSEYKQEKSQSEKSIMIQKNKNQQIIKVGPQKQYQNKIDNENWRQEGMKIQHKKNQYEPIIEQRPNIIICSFCAYLIDQEQKEIFQCQHTFHKICYQSIAPNISYCVYCPDTSRKNGKRQIREACSLCGQSIKIQQLADHLEICQAQNNQLCYYCQTQYPKNLIQDHYKVCQLRQYFQEQSRLKEQIMVSRERQKLMKIEERKKKLSQMKYLMRNGEYLNKQKIEKLFHQVLGKEIATGQQDECMICIQKIQKGEEISTLKCRHIYHNQCLVKWGTKNFSCPACRKELQKKQQKIQEEDDFDWLF